MIRRRNSDEYIRSLERRVKSGLDPADVIALARVYERLGQGEEADADLARGVLRDAYWRDVRAIGAILVELGEETVNEVSRSSSARPHVRPFPSTQILERQGGWIAIPDAVAAAIASTRRLSTSGSIRDVLEFSFRGKPRNMSDISAAAEVAFLEDVLNETYRILSGGFPVPLGTRLRTIRVLSATTSEGHPDFEAPVGSLMTLISLVDFDGTFGCSFRTDDYWADWGDTIDYEYRSMDEFNEDFEVIR